MSKTYLAVHATAAKLGVRIDRLIDHKRFQEPSSYPLGNGLYLRVKPAGGGGVLRYWMHRYTFGKRREDILSNVTDMTLAEACDKVDASKAMLADNHHPRGHIAAVADTKTFNDLATFVLMRDFRETEISATTAKEDKKVFRFMAEATTKIGELPLDQVTQHHIATILAPRWRSAPTAARKQRSRLEGMFDTAISQGWRSNPLNPANKRILVGVLGDPHKGPGAKPKRTVSHAALDWTLLPQILPVIAARPGLDAIALQLAVRTAKRSTEIMLARKDEIDLVKKVWSIPRERMKVKEMEGHESEFHEVPLSPAVIRLIEPLMIDTSNPYLLPGRKRGTHMTHTAIQKLIERMGFCPARAALGERKGRRHGEVIQKDGTVRVHFTTHGMRATFKTWGQENEENDKHTEAALDHSVGDATYRAYGRSKLLELRRKLMDRWNDYVDGKTAGPVEGDNVVPIRRAA